MRAKTARLVASGFLWGFAIAMFACFFWLDHQWQAASPHAPNSQLGLIYSHNNHGDITYFSAFQATSAYLLFVTFPVVALIGWGLAPKKNFQDSRTRWSFRVKFDIDGPKWLMVASTTLGALCAPVVLKTLGPVVVGALIDHGLVLNLG